MGNQSLELVKTCEKAQEQTKTPIIPAVSACDIYRCSSRTELDIWAQHIDPKESNRNTGWITAEALKRAGAKGVFLNHSEHLLEYWDLKQALLYAKNLEMKTLVFVPDLELAQRADALSPDYIAYEAPELVAGEKAIVEFPDQQEKIKKFVNIVKNAVPLTGAGIKDTEDVKKSLQLGVKGVVVASGVVKNNNPLQALLNLSKGFN